MDIRQLRALTAVGEHRSFSRAARVLSTVQSNVSSHISRLEAELGAVLVDRSTGELTAEGQVVAQRAQRIEAELNGILGDVTMLTAQVVGAVRLGLIGTVGRWLVPLLLSVVTEEHPGIALTVSDGTSSLLIPQMGSGQLDLALVTTPTADRSVAITQVFTEDRVVVLPKSHRLANRATLRLSDLVDEELLLEPRGTRFREEMEAYAAVRGITWTAKAEIDGLRLLASLAFAGYGTVILPASGTPPNAAGDWVTVPVQDAPQRVVGLARRRSGVLGPAQNAVERAILGVLQRSVDIPPGVHVIGAKPRN